MWVTLAFFGGIVLVLAVVMFVNFIVVSIKSKTKDIGIIRALGGTGSNVFKIFFFEGLIFAAISAVLGILGGVALTAIMNGVYAVGILEGLKVLRFSLLNLLFVPAATFVLMVIASYLPIRKMSKKSPTEVIKQI